jgi:uncharacterized coiled-coil protein SlyX
MNGQHARITELKIEVERLHKDMAALTRKLRRVAAVLEGIAGELRELLDG